MGWSEENVRRNEDDNAVLCYYAYFVLDIVQVFDVCDMAV